MSVGTLCGAPVSTSGAACSGVNACEVAEISDESTTRATPKSAIAGSPYREMRMFCGLMSPCSTPASWTAARAPASLTPARSTSGTGSGPSFLTLSRSEPFSKKSIAMYGLPERVTPVSKTVTTLGWPVSRPVSWSSRWKRRMVRWSTRSTDSTLSATTRSRRSW
ncbi:hypothetical protein MF672_026220 [Actinomadura sp. ATCC 31491]|uniref:Secreted protein n=1 Tax=Actinomadura luzonensis TaxID=2805427 RepID=A0ABT0FY23_9ACTN|nr:hypothetical protein [Actinomadura luzonensis]MCK2217257.1 hypothetical protein [Actinomadura luzonensis]